MSGPAPWYCCAPTSSEDGCGAPAQWRLRARPIVYPFPPPQLFGTDDDKAPSTCLVRLDGHVCRRLCRAGRAPVDASVTAPNIDRSPAAMRSPISDQAVLNLHVKKSLRNACIFGGMLTDTLPCKITDITFRFRAVMHGDAAYNQITTRTRAVSRGSIRRTLSTARSPSMGSPVTRTSGSRSQTSVAAAWTICRASRRSRGMASSASTLPQVPRPGSPKSYAD